MPLANVSLMGPNPAQGIDLQTQQAQLQQAQQIAQALIAQGIGGGGSPVIHTGGGNPFARDVANWEGPLSKALLAATGTYRQGKLNAEQQDLAQQVIAQREEGMANMARAGQPIEPAFGTVLGDQGGPGDALPSPAPDRTVQTRAGQEGGLANAALAGLTQASPEVRAMAMAILNKQMDIAGKRMVTPEAMSSLGGNYDPKSFPASMTREPLTGAPILSNPENLVQIPKPVQTPMGDVTSFPRTAGAGAGAVPSITNQPSGMLVKPGEMSPDGKTKNDTPFTMTYDYRTGEFKRADLGDPKFDTQKEMGQKVLVDLEAGKKQYQQFLSSAPTLVTLEGITKNLAFGGGAQAVQDARRYLKTLGVSDDQLGKIVDAQTFIKFMTGPATEAIHDVSARPAVLEFSNIMSASAADIGADPRTAVNVLHKYMVEGLNKMQNHNDTVDMAARMPSFSGGQAELYRSKVSPEDLLKRLSQHANEKGVSINYRRDPVTERWMDPLLGTEASHREPGAAAAGSNVIQFVPGGTVK